MAPAKSTWAGCLLPLPAAGLWLLLGLRYWCFGLRERGLLCRERGPSLASTLLDLLLRLCLAAGLREWLSLPAPLLLLCLSGLRLRLFVRLAGLRLRLGARLGGLRLRLCARLAGLRLRLCARLAGLRLRLRLRRRPWCLSGLRLRLCLPPVGLAGLSGLLLRGRRPGLAGGTVPAAVKAMGLDAAPDVPTWAAPKPRPWRTQSVSC